MTGGRKPKPVTLERVTYPCPSVMRRCLWHGHGRTTNAKHTRFTVRRDYKPDPKRPGWTYARPFYAVWDRQHDDWLYPNPKLPANSRRQYWTRDEAKEYLKRTTTTNRAYRLEMLNRALDGQAA
ncbi:MAG: hypothetical protein WAN06_09255 [Candidatus Sulfotelmatobacter sp.]